MVEEVIMNSENRRRILQLKALTSNDNRCALRRFVEEQKESPLLKSNSSGVERLVDERLMAVSSVRRQYGHPRVVAMSTAYICPGVLCGRNSLVPRECPCSTE